MRSLVLVLLVAAVVFQVANTQCIRSPAGTCGGVYGSCGCGVPACSSAIVAPAPAIYQPCSSVAASLADTLSLLTVSSLLADTLPLGPSVVMAPACGCGCGGLGCGGLGYGLGGCGGFYY